MTSAENRSPAIFARSRALVLFLCALFIFGGELKPQTFKTIFNGIEYARVDYDIGGEPVKINLLRLDLSWVRLDVKHANDTALGTETTSSIATRTGAVAAINSGFFRLDKSPFAGDPSGLLKIDGKILSESVNNRIAFGIKNYEDVTDIFFGHLNTKQLFIRGIDDIFLISGLNRERAPSETVVYTPEFGKATPANPDGFEMIVRNRMGDGIRRTGGETPIPSEGFVLSFGSRVFADDDSGLKRLINGKQLVRLAVQVVSDDKELESKFVQAEDIVAGVPLLIRNGKINITWEQEKANRTFVENRHPRTAIARLEDGKFLMITVDGRKPGVSVGMTLPELAEYLKSLGAIEAMNLDGGGSTTMFLNGKVVNSPSDATGERKVSDAITVRRRNVPDRPVLRRRTPPKP